MTDPVQSEQEVVPGLGLDYRTVIFAPATPDMIFSGPLTNTDGALVSASAQQRFKTGRVHVCALFN